MTAGEVLALAAYLCMAALGLLGIRRAWQWLGPRFERWLAERRWREAERRREAFRSVKFDEPPREQRWN